MDQEITNDKNDENENYSDCVGIFEFEWGFKDTARTVTFECN